MWWKVRTQDACPVCHVVCISAVANQNLAESAWAIGLKVGWAGRNSRTGDGLEDLSKAARSARLLKNSSEGL